MRHCKIYFAAVSSFILGCMFTLSITNFDGCNVNHDVFVRHQAKASLNKVASYVALIISNPNNFDRRRTIRKTWLELKSLIAPSIIPSKENNVIESKEFDHYFVVGVSSLSDSIRAQLRNEQNQYGDLLILPQLKDQYTSLSEKLLQSIRWIHLNYPNIQYLIKCDDDSFVRIDKLIQELKIIRKKALQSLKSSVSYSAPGEYQKEMHMPVTGLYWGYFIGKARVKLTGHWAEANFFLCDKYLPYALGGGYVISTDVLEFVARNSHSLQLYNSEDVSMGVWTAPLSHIQRLHDIRFDTEWSSRGCNDSHIIRHKQSIKDMEKMYSTLMESHNVRLCRVPSVTRPYYEYNWAVPPSLCCKPKEDLPAA